MNIVEKINLILKKANISKVNLAKYLGVSRQMVYNYLDGEDLSKLPSDKCQLLLNLLDVSDEKEIMDIDINNDYIQKVSNKLYNIKKPDSKKTEVIELTGLRADEVALISDITLVLRDIFTDIKSREEEKYAIVEYIYHFVQNINTSKELKYVLGFFSKNFGYTDPNKFVFDENNQYLFESFMYSAMSLYNNGGASKTKVAECHKRWENVLASKKEEKLSRTQELNTAKIQALRELGYDKIDEKNAGEVLDKIAEIISQKI